MQQFSLPLHRHPRLPSDTRLTPHRHPRLPFVTYAFHRHHPRLPHRHPRESGGPRMGQGAGPFPPNRVPSYSTRSPRPSPAFPRHPPHSSPSPPPSLRHPRLPHRHPRLLPVTPAKAGAPGWVRVQGLSAPNRVPSYSTRSPRPSPTPFLRHPPHSSPSPPPPPRHPRLPLSPTPPPRHPRLPLSPTPPPRPPRESGGPGMGQGAGPFPPKSRANKKGRDRQDRPPPFPPTPTSLPTDTPASSPSPPPPPRHPRESGGPEMGRGAGPFRPKPVPAKRDAIAKTVPRFPPSPTSLLTVTPASSPSPPRKRGPRDGPGCRAFPPQTRASKKGRDRQDRPPPSLRHPPHSSPSPPPPPRHPRESGGPGMGQGAGPFRPKSRASKRDAIPVVSPASPASPSAGSIGHRTTGDCSRSACSRWPPRPVPRRSGHAPAPSRC